MRILITETTGDLLKARVDALVNTVNTEGVMGKGIALQFRRSWPEMFDDYEKACARGDVQMGRMHVWHTNQLDGPRLIINFPTKLRWRSKSRIDDIQSGLRDLTRVIREEGVRSIAIPPLGCGNGGLEWLEVRPLILSVLSPVAEGIDILLYAPDGPPPAKTMENRTSVPELNGPRSAMLALMHEYSLRACHQPSLIEVQKLAYFLQLSGEDLNLEFVPHHYGPYADGLRRGLSSMEGHYICGFGDGSAQVKDAEPIEVMDDALSLAEAYLAEHPDTQHRMETVLQEIGGFESTYGLELLATVQWVMAANPAAAASEAVTRMEVQTWSDRKRGLFSDEHVRAAWSAVLERGMVEVRS